jgi:hypothetical protein
MAEIVCAVAASHAPGLIGLFDGAPPESQAAVREMYGALAQEIQAAELDVLILFANDHLANSKVLEYPDFLIGMADVHTGPYEWFQPWIGCRDYALPGRPEVAEAVYRGMALDGAGVAVVPVLQNCTVPPIPDQHRCYEVGRALGDIIANDLPAGMRVGLFGSGGLSHEPGGARYFFIDTDFDEWFLGLLTHGDHEKILAEVTPERLERSGSGGTAELYAWFVVLGAIGERPCTRLGYTAYDNFKCGVGAVRWDTGTGSVAR